MDKQPRIQKCPVVLDPDRADAALTARDQLNAQAESLLKSFPARVQAEILRRPHDDPQDVGDAVYQEDQAKLEALQAAVSTADESLNEYTTWYSFRPLGWKAWRALKKAHPSKNKDEEFDVDTLAPVLLKEASYEPKLSAGDVEDLLESDQWAESEIWMLITAAVTAQR